MLIGSTLLISRVLLRQPPGETQGVIGLLVSISRWSNGLKRKTIEVDGYIIPYLEGGSGEPLILVHGFGGQRSYTMSAILSDS